MGPAPVRFLRQWQPCPDTQPRTRAPYDSVPYDAPGRVNDPID